MSNSRLWTFSGGDTGSWTITKVSPVVGESLPPAAKLEITPGPMQVLPEFTAWVLRGVTSNERYVTKTEKSQLVAAQAALGRPGARCGALIPIRKNAAWWALTQEERRAIFEEGSNHIKTGLRFLPAIARRLHHCRDLGEAEPFDFLTLFDYAPEDSEAFEELVSELRLTEEWKYVDREVDVRMVRNAAPVTV